MSKVRRACVVIAHDSANESLANPTAASLRAAQAKEENTVKGASKKLCVKNNAKNRQIFFQKPIDKPKKA